MSRVYFGKELFTLPAHDVPARVRVAVERDHGIVCFYNSKLNFFGHCAAFAIWEAKNDFIRYIDGPEHGLDRYHLTTLARQVWDGATKGDGDG